MSINPALTCLNCANNSLTSLDISANNAITYLYCNNNALTQPAVDGILQKLVSNGQISGSVELSAGSSAAPSSKASGSNYYTLQNARGWTIVTN